MRVAIDAFRLVDEPGTSGATYVTVLTKLLIGRPEVASVTLLVPREPDASFGYSELLDLDLVNFAWPRQAAYPSKDFRRTVKWIQITVPRLMRRVKADWYIAPYHQAPVALPRSVRVLTVIHDVCGLLPSAGYRWDKKAPYRHLFNFLTGVWRSDAFVYVSGHTKSRFERLFPWTRRSISRVILNRLGSPSTSEAQAASSLEYLGHEPGSYFLAFGSPSPRKGLDVTLASFRLYVESGGTASLVLVSPGGFVRRLRHLVLENQLGSRVTILSWVSEQQRDALYWGSLALLFPSRCEGFGYPILEALFWGCPTIAWRRSPAAELVERTIPLVEDLDPVGIATWLHAYSHISSEAREVLRDSLRGRARELGRIDQAHQFAELLLSRA